jgi:hypothetical protein
MSAAGSINMALKRLEDAFVLADASLAQDTGVALMALAYSCQAVAKGLYCRLKWIECTLLLKHLTGMGSPKTALGLMTPVA